MLHCEKLVKRINDSYELPNNVLVAVQEPVVTVDTITNNHAPFIEKCIQGVLMQQTTFPFEYIIGEDFSTDGTREIVFEYAKKYPDIIRVITADYNVGADANSLRCFKAMRGRYLASCEGDDYWTDPLKLQKQVDFMEKNPEYVMCYHKFIEKNLDRGIEIIRPRKGRDYTADELVVTSGAGAIATATTLCRNVFKIENDEVTSRYLEAMGDLGTNTYLGT